MPQPFDLAPVLAAVEPAEAVEYFRQKGYRIGFDYRDVWQQEHQAAFTVAKAMQIDLLQEIRGQVDKALAEGTTFADFKRALKPALVDRGWWGKQEVMDPQTGEAQVAQLGSARRLGVIFDTNLATAYSEGQWERIQRNKGLFPFLEYVRSASAHPRVSHLAYAGTVLPADHPFWRAHMPVKEWGCKCTVIQHSQRSLEREGLAVTDAPLEEMRSLVNKRTGETMEIPVGVDPAFHYPPGGRRANLGKMMMDKADAASASTAARVLADGAAQWAPLVQTEFAEFVGRYAEGERREIGTRRVVGVFSPEVLQRLASAGLEPQKATIAVDMRRLQHLLGSNRDAARQAKGTGAKFLASVPASLLQLGEAWLDADKKRLYLFGTSTEPGKAVRTVVELDVPMRRDEVSNTVVSTMLMDPADQDKTGLVQIQ